MQEFRSGHKEYVGEVNATVTSDTTLLYQKKSRKCGVKSASAAFGGRRLVLAATVIANYDLFRETEPRRSPL